MKPRHLPKSAKFLSPTRMPERDIELLFGYNVLMTNQPGDSQEPGLQNAGSAEGTATTAAAGLSPAGDAQAPASGEAAPPKKLTAEEQMAQYEDDLKNTDWGHQPC